MCYNMVHGNVDTANRQELSTLIQTTMSMELIKRHTDRQTEYRQSLREVYIQITHLTVKHILHEQETHHEMRYPNVT